MRNSLRYRLFKFTVPPDPVCQNLPMMPPEKLHEFWQQPHPSGNEPADYIGVVERSEALLKLVTDLPQTARILEVGCNVGRNLAYLYDHGYHHVEGIEISPHAVQMLRATYPQLADRPIAVGPAETLLPGFGDKAFDLVFTMAVLEHIHPESGVVFDNMARIAKQVLAVEPTAGHRSLRQFPHNIEQLFVSRGFVLSSSAPMSTEVFEAQPTSGGYTAYRFIEPEQLS